MSKMPQIVTKLNLIVIYFFFLIFMGLGYLAIQPVFEGFDENAHYSSVRQLADLGTIPIYGKSYLDLTFVDYKGPMPYTSGAAPYDQGRVASKFFNDTALVANYAVEYRQAPYNTPYEKSTVLNWQAQHPPLYYVLAASVLNLVSGFAFVTQIFVLRLFSYLLAVIGVMFGILALNKKDFSNKNNYASSLPAMLGFVIYPIILPMFFPEFVRIGNDSLCLLLVGVLAYLFASWQSSQHNSLVEMLIGITLGIGILVKAFFLPIAAGFALYFLMILHLQTKVSLTAVSETPAAKNKSLQTKVSLTNISQIKRTQLIILNWQRFQPLIRLFLPVVLIGGSWYLYQYLSLGHITASADTASLQNQGGLLLNLKLHFSLKQLLAGLVAPVVTFIWAGSWSLVRLNLFFYIPLITLFGWVITATYLHIKKLPLTNKLWLPIFVVSFFLLGLISHVVISIALLGIGNTPGWYLHILMPLTAPLFGYGVYSILQKPKQRWAFFVLISYAVLFQAVAIWAQFALYTGCAIKGLDKYYQWSSHAYCLEQTSLLLTRLAVIGWPKLAIFGFTIGFVLMWVMIALIFRAKATYFQNLQD